MAVLCAWMCRTILSMHALSWQLAVRRVLWSWLNALLRLVLITLAVGSIDGNGTVFVTAVSGGDNGLFEIFDQPNGKPAVNGSVPSTHSLRVRATGAAFPFNFQLASSYTVFDYHCSFS